MGSSKPTMSLLPIHPKAWPKAVPEKSARIPISCLEAVTSLPFPNKNFTDLPTSNVPFQFLTSINLSSIPWSILTSVLTCILNGLQRRVKCLSSIQQPSLSSTFPRRMNSTKFPSALPYVLVLTCKKNCCNSVQHGNVGLGYYYMPAQQTLLQRNRHLI